MTKILVWYWGRRGAGPRYTLELARALKLQDDLEVHLSLSRQSEIVADFDALKLPTHFVDTYTDRFSAFRSLFRLPMVSRSFQSYLTEHGIRIVLCTMSHLWNIAMLGVLGRTDVRYVLTVHDAVPHPGDNYLVRQKMLSWEISASDGVLTLTDHVRDLLCKTYNYPSERVRVIPHGALEYASTGVARTFPATRPMRLLFFGRILPYKGLDILLEAFEIIEREYANVDLHVVGSGDLSPYQRAISRLTRVKVTNRWIAESEIGGIFEPMDLVIAPYTEASQSGVLAVAFAAAVPAIVTPVGGLSEQVDHLENGLVVREPTAIALADGIRYFLDNPAFYDRCSASALRKANNSLSWDAIGRRTRDALLDIVSMPARRL